MLVAKLVSSNADSKTAGWYARCHYLSLGFATYYSF